MLRNTIARTFSASGRHLEVQEWSEHAVFCTFSPPNVLRARTACTFSTSQLPKVLWKWCVLHTLTCKCASRHNGVQFFIFFLASWYALYFCMHICIGDENVPGAHHPPPLSMVHVLNVLTKETAECEITNCEASSLEAYQAWRLRGSAARAWKIAELADDEKLLYLMINTWCNT